MSRPAKDPRVRDELLADGSMVLFHTESRELLTLNATAAVVWEHCDGSMSDEEIAGEMRAIFPDAPEVESDVARILRKLRSRGVVLDRS